jgi:hypothetical protein
MSEQGQLKKDKKGSIPDMPCELLDHIASQIDEGKDLISWIKACKLGGVVNLGDLELLAKLPLAIRNVDISLKRYLCVIGNVSRFYAIIQVGIHCLTVLFSVHFSKKTEVILDFYNFKLDYTMTVVLRDLIAASNWQA